MKKSESVFGKLTQYKNTYEKRNGLSKEIFKASEDFCRALPGIALSDLVSAYKKSDQEKKDQILNDIKYLSKLMQDTFMERVGLS